MKKKTKKAVLVSLLSLGLILTVVFLVIPKIHGRLFPNKSASNGLTTTEWSKPSEVLGAFIQDTLPEITQLKTGTESGSAASSIGGATQEITKETEKVIRETINTVLETVKESVAANVSINQEKIVEEVTAKLLQSILDKAGGTSRPVDSAIYDACTNIIKNASSN